MRLPRSSTIDLSLLLMTPCDERSERKLSDLRGQFLDTEAYERELARGDPLLYMVYQNLGHGGAGELYHGLTVLQPGRVGCEYYMTKGHFHAALDTSEVYYCLRGKGYMLMETPQGDTACEAMAPGLVVYVPGTWAHRMVNVGEDPLLALFVYPGYAGHDYGTIEQRGFRRVIVERTGQPAVVDNPRWNRQDRRH